MAQVTAALIKQLRDKTGVGIMKCRKALTETDGDVAKAMDWLREQGVKSSVAERSTEEGIVAAKVSDDGRAVALLELQCETDFAARNDTFKELADKLITAGLNSDAADTAGLEKVDVDGVDAAQAVKVAINTIGENIRLQRFGRDSLAGDGVIGTYVHMNGKLASAVGLKAGKAETAAKDEVKTLVKQLCMHVAGAPIPPLALNRDGLDADAVAKERAAIKATMENDPKDSKKPDNIKEKIIDGKMNRYYSERILPEQKFVMDDKLSIKEVIGGVAKGIGDSLEVVWFHRWAIGG